MWPAIPVAISLRARALITIVLILSKSKKPSFLYTIGDWLEIKPGTKERPLLSMRYFLFRFILQFCLFRMFVGVIQRHYGRVIGAVSSPSDTVLDSSVS